MFEANLKAIVDNLTVRHHLPLTPRDLARLTFVYTSFFKDGPGLDYAPGDSVDLNGALPTYADLMTATPTVRARRTVSWPAKSTTCSSRSSRATTC